MILNLLFFAWHMFVQRIPSRLSFEEHVQAVMILINRKDVKVLFSQIPVETTLKEETF